MKEVSTLCPNKHNKAKKSLSKNLLKSTFLIMKSTVMKKPGNS